MEKRNVKIDTAVVPRMSQQHATRVSKGPRIKFDLSTVGGRIAAARIKLELTQKQVAALLGVSRGTVIQYEVGLISPPLEKLHKLGNILAASPSWLAFGVEGIKGLEAGDSHIIPIPQVEHRQEGDQVTGAYSFAADLFAAGQIDEQSKVLVLSRPVPSFGLGKHDRVVITPTDSLDRDYRLYAIHTDSGYDIVQLLPGLIRDSSEVEVRDGLGVTRSLDRSKLAVSGLVVASIRKENGTRFQG